MAFDFSAHNPVFRDTGGISAQFRRGFNPAVDVAVVEGRPNSLEPVAPRFRTFWLILADLPTTPIEGDKLTVASVEYLIVAPPHRDGTGGAYLTVEGRA